MFQNNFPNVCISCHVLVRIVNFSRISNFFRTTVGLELPGQLFWSEKFQLQCTLCIFYSEIRPSRIENTESITGLIFEV